VTDEDGLILPELVDQGDRVADEVEQRVSPDVRRLLAAGVAALVRGDDPVPGCRKRPELVSPGVPALGPTVQQEDQRPVSLLGDVRSDPVYFDEAVYERNLYLDLH
jgi:hypothetical protein